MRSAPGAPHASSPGPGGERALSGRRILVVDDNPDTVLTLAAMLGELGSNTRTAGSGAEALEIAARYRPDAILLDIGMPDLNGYDTARRIRGEPWGRDAVLVALSGWGQPEDVQRAMEAGFDRHIVKPVDPPALVAALGALLGAKRP